MKRVLKSSLRFGRALDGKNSLRGARIAEYGARRQNHRSEAGWNLS